MQNIYFQYFLFISDVTVRHSDILLIKEPVVVALTAR